MQQQLRKWRKILSKYNRPHFKQIPHLMGYLGKCQETGELLPDPYINEWVTELKLVIRRAHEEDQLALVSLHDTLMNIK